MNAGRIRDCIRGFTRLVERESDEPRIIDEGRALLEALVRADDWLPDEFARPNPQRYQQYLLHCDPLERFSMVSFVWGPGQRTPVHDHTVWGLIGMLRGTETARSFARREPEGRLEPGAEVRLVPGQVEAVSPRIGDIHEVANGLTDRPSISIHVYGGNIGAVRRHVFDRETGAPKAFISGYSSAVLPNVWDRSAEAAGAG